jgi:hypothetical protein
MVPLCAQQDSPSACNNVLLRLRIDTKCHSRFILQRPPLDHHRSAWCAHPSIRVHGSTPNKFVAIICISHGFAHGLVPLHCISSSQESRHRGYTFNESASAGVRTGSMALLCTTDSSDFSGGILYFVVFGASRIIFFFFGLCIGLYGLISLREFYCNRCCNDTAPDGEF